jgi:AAA family ATP:ADP antiporter
MGASEARDGDNPADRPPPRFRGWAALHRIVSVEPAEAAAVAWAWVFFFTALTAYYVIRPIRDDMGVAGGVENLAWLFTGTLAGMAAANPAFGYVAARFPRAQVVSIGYRFFALNLVLFFLFFTLLSGTRNVWAGRVFFVWSAVFNLFAVSMFWSAMTDVFTPAQGRRLFGFIAAGGTIGSIAGSALTSGLVRVIGAGNLLLLSAVLLEVAAFSARRVFRHAPRPAEGSPADERLAPALGRRALDGFRRTAAEPYLRGIAIYVGLYTVLTTFLYFQQATIVDAAFTDRVARTRFFANVDLTVNVLALLTQTLATARLVRVLGLTAALAYLPALTLIGFAALGLMPTIATLMTFQVIRRASEFAIAKPAREVLFTSTPPADRYQAKNFIDTVVYRIGDQVGAWAYAILLATGLSVSGISWVAIAASFAWMAMAVWLGRAQRGREFPDS